MKIAIVGTGYVGLVTGVCFADMGNDVICVDIDEQKITNLRDGKLPIFEPGLQHTFERALETRSIAFTLDLESAVEASWNDPGILIQYVC